jgi:ABC-type antimicrobial peptide transport system permease subunit
LILVALRGLLGRKLRAALTALAVVLGVSMISGTYVLTDTIQSAFDAIFTESYRGTDAVVTAKTAFDLNEDGGFSTETLPESTLDKVRALPDVAAAIGGVGGEATLIDKKGKPITSGGAPNLGFSVNPSEPRFESLTLVKGSWPSGPQVAIDEATAKKKHFAVGDEIGVVARGPAQRFQISGIVRFGAVSSIGGASLAAFDLPTAQRLFDKVGRLDQIRVAAETGVSREKLVAGLREALGPNVTVRSGGAQAQEDAKGTNQFISFLQKFLLAFGGIALFVGSFVIANTLSITIAQRTREFATIRTIGGSRRQILGSVIVEALVIGLLASVTGLFLGLLLAKGLNSLFEAAGIDLPKVGLVFATRTIVISLLVGVVITLVASLRPALRATRIPPIAAVREGATLPEGRWARFRPYAAVLLAALGVAMLCYGLFKGGLGTVQVLLWLGAGALLIFFGVALFAAKLVQPLGELVSPVATFMVAAFSVLFYPVLFGFWLVRYGTFETRASTLERVGAFLGGALLVAFLVPLVLLMWLFQTVGLFHPEWPIERPSVIPDEAARKLARENAQRNPQRTASTASALMIGLALVTLVAVLAQGLRATFAGWVDDIFVADYALTAQNNFSPLPVSIEQAAAQVPAVTSAVGIRSGQARVFGKTEFISAVDPDISKAVEVDWAEGSPAVPAQLDPNGAFTDNDFADKHDLRVGSTVSVLTPGGKTLRLVIRGIIDPPTAGSPYGPVTLSAATFDANYPQPTNQLTFVNMRSGVTPENTKRLEEALSAFPNAKVQDREEFKKNQISGINTILNILYVLLALSVIVSLFGIVNTLALSVFERTRELGLLRAIGTTRRQVRQMIRQESVVTALIGAVLGIALGVALGALLAARIEFVAFNFSTIPFTTLIIVAIAAIVVGILAAILPARRASRLNVLEALQYE